MDEFIPLQYFYRITRLWWLIIATTLIGAGFGFTFHHWQPPVYEAAASINVTIDLTQFEILTDIPKDKLLYNEDLALSVTDQAFQSTEAYKTVLARCQAEGLPIAEVGTLFDNHTLERRHGNWLIYYRHTDPQVAHAVADIWAQVAYENLTRWLANGEIPSYLVLRPPAQTTIPTEPVDFGLNKLIMAGSLIGLLIGIMFANFLAQRTDVSQHSPTKT